MGTKAKLICESFRESLCCLIRRHLKPWTQRSQRSTEPAICPRPAAVVLSSSLSWRFVGLARNFRDQNRPDVPPKAWKMWQLAGILSPACHSDTGNQPKAGGEEGADARRPVTAAAVPARLMNGDTLIFVIPNWCGRFN